MPIAKTIRLGTRASPLALWQAHHVASLIRASWPQIDVELITIETTGDRVRDKPLSQIGGDGLFTKQIQIALQDRHVDVAVHSLKDLPTAAVEGLMLAAVPPRGPTGDALVSRRHQLFDALPPGATVATSSLRRRAQLLNRRPDLHLVEIRGNVETRLSRLASLDLDATVLAQAGLERLDRAGAITEILDPLWMLPAVGQGALGLECRTNDLAVLEVLAQLDHRPTALAVRAERAMLRALGGGCQVPIGAATSVEQESLTLIGTVLPPSGSRRIMATIAGELANAEDLGQRLANLLLAQGAAEILTT